MAKIISTKVINAKSNGKPWVLVTTPEKDVFVPLGMFRNSAQTDTFDVFDDGEIFPTYFSKGDKLLNGSICTEDNTILESVVLRKNQTIVAKIAAEEQLRKTAQMDDMLALQKRKRAEKDRILAEAIAASKGGDADVIESEIKAEAEMLEADLDGKAPF